MALTRIQNDVCSVYDSDRRNEDIYDYQLSNIGNYRRGYVLNDQMFNTAQRGLEQDVDLESKLQGLQRVANSCNAYGVLPQCDILASASPVQSICVGNALAPQYTRGTKVTRDINIYQSARAKFADYQFVSPAVEHPSYGMFDIQYPTSTQAIAKAEAERANRTLLQQRGSKNF